MTSEKKGGSENVAQFYGLLLMVFGGEGGGLTLANVCIYNKSASFFP